LLLAVIGMDEAHCRRLAHRVAATSPTSVCRIARAGGIRRAPREIARRTLERDDTSRNQASAGVALQQLGLEVQVSSWLHAPEQKIIRTCLARGAKCGARGARGGNWRRRLRRRLRLPAAHHAITNWQAQATQSTGKIAEKTAAIEQATTGVSSVAVSGSCDLSSVKEPSSLYFWAPLLACLAVSSAGSHWLRQASSGTHFDN